MEEQTRPERMRNAWSRAYYQSQQHQAESMSSTSSGVHETCFKARGHDLQGLTVAHGKASPPGRLLLHPWMHSDSFYGLRSRKFRTSAEAFCQSRHLNIHGSPSQSISRRRDNARVADSRYANAPCSGHIVASARKSRFQ